MGGEVVRTLRVLEQPEEDLDWEPLVVRRLIDSLISASPAARTLVADARAKIEAVVA
jgi:hypothetical protein